jgi:predicted ATP-dependent serine protease
MKEAGLKEVTNPSEIFLMERPLKPVRRGLQHGRNLPDFVELQAPSQPFIRPYRAEQPSA